MAYISQIDSVALTRTPQWDSVTCLRSEAPNWVYRYGARPGKWTQIMPEDRGVESKEQIDAVEEPQPRYAHQVVYEEGSKTVFLHGGNAGMGSHSSDVMERRTSTSRSEDAAVDSAEGDGASRMARRRPVRGEGEKARRLLEYDS